MIGLGDRRLGGGLHRGGIQCVGDDRLRANLLQRYGIGRVIERFFRTLKEQIVRGRSY